jgi:hypothetical protein
MNDKKKNRPKGTIVALSEALGVTAMQIHNLIKQGMPDDVEGALKWRGIDPSGEMENSPEALRKQKILLTAQHVRLATVKADMESGKLLDRAKCKEAYIQAWTNVRQRLLRMAENEMPPRLAGMDEIKIKKLLRAEILEIMESISSGSFDLFNDE